MTCSMAMKNEWAHQGSNVRTMYAWLSHLFVRFDMYDLFRRLLCEKGGVLQRTIRVQIPFHSTPSTCASIECAVQLFVCLSCRLVFFYPHKRINSQQ